MKSKAFLIIMILVLTAALSGIAQADDAYTFTLTEGGSKTDESEYWSLNLSVPAVSGMADKELENALNQYFLSYIDYVTEEYEADKAYFTANYEGEDNPHFSYQYYYNIISDTEDYFTFKTTLFYGTGSSMSVNEYWTLDKHTGELLELSDMADSERLEEIKGMILDAMKRENEKGELFWTDDETYDAAFSFIEEYRHWYISEAGNLVITFDKYEIAPGSYGENRFEILDDEAVLLGDQNYKFELTSGGIVEYKSSNWYLKIDLPVISGLADKDEEDAMNAHFADVADGINKEYEMAVATAETSMTGEDGPHFGYEYNHEVIADTENYFSFKTSAFFAAGSSMTSNEYWTLDKNTGEPVKWEDVVPEDRMQTIHDQIFAEMQAANESGEGMYYTTDDSLNVALKNVPAFHHWYMDKNENLVIAFDKYEIAVGAQGTPEFVIK